MLWHSKILSVFDSYFLRISEFFPCSFQDIAQCLILQGKPCFHRKKNIVDIPGCHPHEVSNLGRIEASLPHQLDCNPSCIYGLRISPFAKDLTRSQVRCICNCIDDFLKIFVHDICFSPDISQIVPKEKRMVSHPLILKFYFCIGIFPLIHSDLESDWSVRQLQGVNRTRCVGGV